MKKTIIILIEEDGKDGQKLRHEIVGDKITLPMAQALIDEALKASGGNLLLDINLKK